MSKEILEITATGGIYCVIPAVKSRVYDFARPNGHTIRDLLSDLRTGDDDMSLLTDGDILRWALARICESQMGRSMAHDARFDDWIITVEDITDISIDTRSKHMVLPRFAEAVTVFTRSQEAQMKFVFTFIKALRLVWQSNMISGDADSLSPEDFILFTRLKEADSDLISVFAAYQLRERGDHDVWRSVLTSDLHRVAITLCECLDFDASQDGILDAMGFVFQDWFLDEARLARVDHQSLELLDRIGETALGNDQIEFEDVLQISMMADGFSYLEYSAADILTDEFFTQVSDVTNKAHLGQILNEGKIEPVSALGFHDAELARKIFPNSTFETVV